jgi:hypothetical protein
VEDEVAGIDVAQHAESAYEFGVSLGHAGSVASPAGHAVNGADPEEDRETEPAAGSR